LTVSHGSPEPHSGERALVFRLLEDYCAGKGLRLTAGDPHGHAGLIEAPSGKRWFFKGTRFDINPLGASEIAGDKAYAGKFLALNGIAVPASYLVSSADIRDGRRPPEDVLDFAEEQEFPLFVKPNIGQEGQGVMRVDTYHTLQNALHILAKNHGQLLVQEEIKGKDLRVIVLDGDVLCAIERQPPQVTGDGVRSLAQLVDAHERINAADGRIDFELSQQGLMLESVPARGQIVSLLPVSNLSSGGSAQIVTDALAPEIHTMARLAAKTLGLRYCGVDLIIPEARRPDTAAVVLEVNASPGLSVLARRGDNEANLVREIYQKVFAEFLSA